MRSFMALPCQHRRLFITLLAISVVAFATACNSNNSTPTDSMTTDTPHGSTLPRTALPMPPVAAAHGASSSGPADAPRSTGAQSWTMLDGRRMRASDYKGKVLVLDFWATYCPPCREEVPHLIALQKRYGAQGLNVVGLNVGGDEDRPKVPGFVQQFGISYPLGYPDDEFASAIFSQTDAIPQTYVFDRNGRLVKRFVGFDPAAATALDNAVQTALATN